MDEEESSELQDWEFVPKSEELSSTEDFQTLPEIPSDYVGVLKSDRLSLGFFTNKDQLFHQHTDSDINLSQFPNCIDHSPFFPTKSGGFLFDSSSDFSEFPSTDHNSGIFDNPGKFWGVLDSEEAEYNLIEDLDPGNGDFIEECGDLAGFGCFNGVEKKNNSVIWWKSEDFGNYSSRYPSESATIDGNFGNIDNFGKICNVLRKDHCQNKELDSIECEPGLNKTVSGEIGNYSKESGDIGSDWSKYLLDNRFISDNSEKNYNIVEFWQDFDHFKNRGLVNVGSEEIITMDVNKDPGIGIGNNTLESGRLAKDEKNMVNDEQESVALIRSNYEIGGGIGNTIMESGDLAENACPSEFVGRLGEMEETMEEDKNKRVDLIGSNGEVCGRIGNKTMESGDLTENGCFDGIFGKLSGMEDIKGKKKKGVEWWKLPFEFVRLCVVRVGPIWVFTAAAAMVAFIFMKRRLYRVKERRKALDLKVTIDDNKQMSHFTNKAARINEALSLAKRAAFLRPTLPLFPALALW